MELLTPYDTLYRIILRAKEYEAQVPTDSDGEEFADDVDGADGEGLSALEDDINTSVEDELRTALEDLGDDQLAEVLAFAWVGQGSYDASEWDEAYEAATDEVTNGNPVDELMDMPMLPSTIEAGMAAFDLDFDGVGEES